jgi:ubiquinone/menaquinone biosynthesis C-methylase UbiE
LAKDELQEKNRMEPKPAFLGPHVASAFQEASVIEAYPRRAPYPESLFQKLAELMTGASRAVLDVGTGPGDVARNLAPFVERVDAVDWSAGMIALGQQLPGGDDPRICWIQGRIEEVTLEPPYGLITAGESLHWMDWSVILPRFVALLEPSGFLAVVDRHAHEPPWQEALKPVFRHYSVIRNWRPYNVVQELESRGLFRRVGEWESEPVSFAQPVEDYVEALHSMSGFARERMDQDAVSAFDDVARAILLAHADENGILHMQIVGTVEWGTPLEGA